MNEEKYMEIFRDEARSHLDTLERCVLDIESKGPLSELIKEGMRSAHTIKGSARLLGLEDIGKVAHAIEDLFKEIDSGKLSVSSAVITAILKGVDGIKRMIDGENVNADELVDGLRGGFPDEVKKYGVSGEKAEEKKDERKRTEILRIPREKVEPILNYASELFINRMKVKGKFESYERVQKELKEEITEYLKRFVPEEKITPLAEKISSAFSELIEDFRNTWEEVSSLIERVHEGSLSMRYVPFSIIADELRRIVRDVAEEQGKKINFRIRGGDIELDKVDLEKLKPSLIHIIRNAVDHGIELPEVRKREGKKEEGEIEVSVEVIGEFIGISVRDDGKGIDLDGLVRRAVEKGIIEKSKASRLTENEKISLMFEHGISTKSETTEISGRGVGMDVVKTTLLEMRGDVKVETKKGKGTHITLLIPRSSVTLRGIKVKDAEEVIIPVHDIVRIMRVKKEEVIMRGAETFVDFNGKLIPVKPLSTLLGFENARLFDDNEQSYVIVLKNGDRIFGVKITDFTSEDDHIIKSPSALLDGMKFVSGVTLSEEGLPVIVLNTHDLAQAFFKTPLEGDYGKIERRKKRILLVEDSLTTLTIEKNILELAGFEVDTALHGGEALNMLFSKTYDLFVVDIQMPVLDGIELTKKIRSNPSTAQKPVVIVSSVTDEKEMKKAMDAGANVYISKRDFDRAGFISLIRNFLEKTD